MLTSISAKIEKKAKTSIIQHQNNCVFTLYNDTYGLSLNLRKNIYSNIYFFFQNTNFAFWPKLLFLFIKAHSKECFLQPGSNFKAFE